MLDENQFIEEVEEIEEVEDITTPTEVEDEEEHLDTGDTLGTDLSTEENNSQDIILQEIINNLNSEEVVDYSEHFSKIEEKIDTLISLNEQSVSYQNVISSDLSTILLFCYFLIIYLIYKFFSKLLDGLLFKYL